MPPIYRPCYCTREEVKRALDIKGVAYNNEQIDRNNQAASDDVDGLCMRKFFPIDMTRYFDWPNFQYTYPWKLYFDQYDCISISSFISGPFSNRPETITPGQYILRPENEGPPFTRVELRRDLSVFFGNNTTPQQDIAITGTWGYWLQTQPGGTLTAAITDTVSTTIQMSAGAGAFVGVGDVIIIDNERMLVTDSSLVSTGISPTSGGTSSPPSMNDVTFAVASGAVFNVNEVLYEDSEAMRILAINGNNLIVKRGWDGTTLATHSLSAFSANRQITVVRGALGTTPTTHLNSAPINVLSIPGLVKEVALATSLVGLTGEPAAYANLTVRTWSGSTGTTQGQQKEPAPGPGLPDLRDRLQTRYARRTRSRVV
jgi:hypothetical protein